MVLRIIFALFLTSASNASGSGSSLVPLTDSGIEWTYYPSSGDSPIPIPELSIPLTQQVPASVPCCKGEYVGVLRGKSIASYFAGELSFPSIHFPAVHGLKEIWIDGNLIMRSNGRLYDGSGPVVPLPIAAVGNPNLRLVVKIDAPRAFYSGFWLFKLSVGDFEDLNQHREEQVVFQKYYPLFFSVFFFSVGLVLLRPLNRGVAPDGNMLVFLEVLFSWALFYLSLSGQLRNWFPIAGGYFHFLIRIVAGISSTRLLLVLTARPRKELELVKISGIVALIVSAVLSSNGEHRWQIVGYLYVTGLFTFTMISILVGKFRPIRVDGVFRFVVFAGFICMVASVADTVKLILVFFFGMRTDIPYLTRFLDPPFVLAGLYYVSEQAKKRNLSEFRANVARRLSQQLIHDLRSPTTVVRTVISDPSVLDSAEWRDVLLAASKRILGICSSLNIPTVHSARSESLLDLRFAVGEVVSEKRVEWQKKIDFSSSGSACVSKVDETEFKRMVSNLINNAFEASPDGGALALTITAGGRFNCVEILDEGSGFSRITLSEIRERVRTLPTGSTGFGLFHAFNYIEEIGGEIQIESRESGGSRVVVKIPSVPSLKKNAPTE